MVKIRALILLFVTILVACSKSAEVTQTPAQAAVVVTDAIMTPSPVPTNTQTAVPTPSSTPNPTDTRTPTATATSTPTPTPTTAVWVESGTPVSDSEVIALENVEQLTELARWGRGVIRDIDLSADGRWLAVAAGSGAYIHDLQDFEAKPLAIEMGGDVTAVSISPTGDKVAIATDDNKLQLWQVEPLEHLFTDYDDRVLELVQTQFSPDGRILAVVKRRSGSSAIELLDSVSGEVIDSYRPKYEFYPRVEFSPSGSRVAVWSQNDDFVDVYNWEEDTLILEHRAPIHNQIEGVADEEQPYQALVGDVVFLTEDELRLLVVEGEFYIRVSGRVEIQETNKDEILFSVDDIGYLSEATKYVCNEPLVFWDPPELPAPYRMENSLDLQTMALFYQDHGFSGDYAEYSSLRFHRVSDGQLQYIVEEGIVDFEFAPDGQTWVAGLQDGRLQIRQLSDGSVLESVDAYDSPVLDVRISPNDDWIGVVYVDEVKIYRREDGVVHLRYPVSEMAFSPDNKSFALAYEDGHIEIRNLSDGSLINSTVAHEDLVSALSYMPTGELVSAGFDCNLNLWQTPDLVQINAFENFFVEGMDTGEQVPVRVREFLPMADGQTVIGKFYGRDFGVWSVPEGQLMRTPHPEDYSSALSVSFDGASLAVPENRTPESWDDSLTFIETDANEAGFSPDSSLLVGDPWLYAEDYEYGGMLIVWQVEPKRLLHTVGEETEPVTAVTFTHDGQLFISTAMDGIVRLWGIP